VRQLGVPFTVGTKIIRKRWQRPGKNKSTGPDGISGEILKLGGEAMILYFARLLDIKMNNGNLSADWKKKPIVFPVRNGVFGH